MRPIILGSGPAGLTAAIYLARADLKPLLIHGPLPGGQLTLTTHVENFPGFSEGILGPHLMEEMRKQALRFGTTFQEDFITKTDLSKPPYQLFGQKQTYETETLIIATGASAKYLNLSGEKELIGLGISTCATCDGYFYKNKTVYIVGGGDTAMEETLHLSKMAKEVYLVHRRSDFRASVIMQNKVKALSNVTLMMNSEVVELLRNDQGLTGLKIKNLQSGEILERTTDGLFYAIGHHPNSEAFRDYLAHNDQGYLLTNETRCSKPGIFACGDIQDPHFRQAITAAGSGCMAALLAEKYLHDLSSQ